MSAAASSVKKPKKDVLLLLGILVVTAVMFCAGTAFQYFVDKNNYKKGHEAYLQADCSTAIVFFDKVINGSFDKFRQPAQGEKNECLAFQKAYNFESTGDLSAALVAYLDFFTGNVNSPLIGATRNQIAGLFQIEKMPSIAGEISCTRTGTLIENNMIPNEEINLPFFYLICGQFYEQINQFRFASAMYQWLLTTYPNHPASLTAEALLLENPLTCQDSETLRQSMIANRTDFLQKLYYDCGQRYEEHTDYANARKMYETFLAMYPDHALAKEVESSLARTIVAQAKAAGAQEISQPESSGFTTSGVVQVIIQNDSPERLRITFSGPNSQVKELDACPTCTQYSVEQTPMYCPEVGPIERYTLPPGVYDIVVESINDNTVTPWAGNWNLIDGNEYYRCLLLVQP